MCVESPLVSRGMPGLCLALNCISLIILCPDCPKSKCNRLPSVSYIYSYRIFSTRGDLWNGQVLNIVLPSPSWVDEVFTDPQWPLLWRTETHLKRSSQESPLSIHNRVRAGNRWFNQIKIIQTECSSKETIFIQENPQLIRKVGTMGWGAKGIYKKHT